ncbi:MAG: Crp/Fnr family transcriptional regulator [Sphingomicrobium sp.]
MELFVRKLARHSELNEIERTALASLPATRLDIPAHREIVRFGEVVENSCLVSRGLVGRVNQTLSGVRQFASLHLPGEMVDLFSMMAPQAAMGLTAVTRSVILQVPHRALQQVADQYPAVASALWRDCVLQSMIGTQWLFNMGQRDARARMAHLLCEMAVRIGDGPPDVARRYDFPVTQEQMADLLGLTSVHVNRTLMALRREDLVIVARGFVEIVDWKGLVATAEFDPTYLAAGTAKVSGR